MEARTVSGVVQLAVKGLERATARLINLLKSPDEAVRAGASAALRGLDPPPIWELFRTLRKAGDAAFKVEIIRVMGGLGESYRIHVALAFAELWQAGDPAIRRAIVDAFMQMGPAPAEAILNSARTVPSPTPKGGGRNRTRPSSPPRSD
ncbi:hypothetical protein EP7_003087 [Isosphaeraceae bacterium EP7]